MRKRTGAKKPRITGVTGSSTGRKLKAFRLSEGLLQADLGLSMALSGRVISDIERGIRDLSQDEIEAVERIFGIKLDEINTSWLEETAHQVAESRLYTEEEFMQLQQDFLFEHKSERSNQWFDYDLWFLNPESLPMLESDKVKATWIDNLNAGATYNTIWLFDFTPPEELTRFVLRARDVLKGLSVEAEQNGEAAQVHVYPIQIGLQLSNQAEAISRIYSDWLSEAEIADNLELHDILLVENLPENRDALRLLVHFAFEQACVVGYKPRKPFKAPAAVVLALRDVGTFGGSGSKRGYCALGDQSTKDFMALLRYVQEGFAKHEKRGKDDG